MSASLQSSTLQQKQSDLYEKTWLLLSSGLPIPSVSSILWIDQGVQASKYGSNHTTIYRETPNKSLCQWPQPSRQKEKEGKGSGNFLDMHKSFSPILSFTTLKRPQTPRIREVIKTLKNTFLRQIQQERDLWCLPQRIGPKPEFI